MPQLRQVEDRPAKTRQEFVESGLTAQQAAYFLESVVKAKERRQWFQQWDPTEVWHSSRATAWSPQSTAAIAPSCRCQRNATQAFLESDDVRFDWLQICHPHPRDRSIRFVAAGHKYFVDNKPFDLSVTGFVGTFSEDCVRVQGV